MQWAVGLERSCSPQLMPAVGWPTWRLPPFPIRSSMRRPHYTRTKLCQRWGTEHCSVNVKNGEGKNFVIRDGVVVIPKGTVVMDGTVI